MEGILGNASPPSGRYQCNLCSSCFKRPEHLKRHQQGHDGQRRFSCSVCQKSFARSDILARHETTHRYTDQVHEGNLRTRACIECARARERCSKGEPCLRCSSRRLQCAYPEGSTIRRPSGSQPTAPQGPPQDGQAPPTYPYGTSADSALAGHGNPAVASLQDHGESSPISPPTHYGHASLVDPTAGQPTAAPGLIISPGVSATDPHHQPMRSPLHDYPLSFSPQMPPDAFQTPSAQAIGYPNAAYDSSFDFPLNWLPANDAIDISYSSLLSFGMASPAIDPNSSLPQHLPGQPAVGDSALASFAPSHPPGTDMGCSPPAHGAASPADTTTTGSHSATDHILSASSGGLYATSIDGARIPCTARHKRPSVIIYGARPIGYISDGNAAPIQDSRCLGFPSLAHISFRGVEESVSDIRRAVHPQTYDAITQNFQQLCLNRDSVYPCFKSSNLPSIEHMNLFIHLYFEYFSPTLPIIHECFTDFRECWPLTLALAAIGCHYTQTQEFSECVVPMHEFLRRAIAVDFEAENRLSNFSTPITQALILNQVGMLYCGSSQLFRLAESRRGLLTSIVHAHNLLSSSPAPNQHENFREADWEWSVNEETKARLGYVIFLLDCMGAYYFEHKTMFSLHNAQRPLPNDALWNARDAQEASRVLRTFEGNPSLATAIQNLFVEKQLKPNLGEFARIILLHGIYQELFQVKQFCQRPLSSWVPSAQPFQERQDERAGALKHKRLVDMPIFSSWRNASLDCVDVLHWAANGAIAQMAGAEPPIVHHLHMARVVLLTPYKKICTLAKSIAALSRGIESSEQGPSREDGLAAEREVAHWAQHDEHKARLAMIHCGCLFWHVRRYSKMTYHEPLSIFLATLALWAYSSYTCRSPRTQRLHQQHRPQTQQHRENGAAADPEGSGSRSGSVTREPSPSRDSMRPSPGPAQSPHSPNSSRTTSSSRNGGILPSVPVLLSPQAPSHSDAHHPTFIRLDRPNDDEMVQLFVRAGGPRQMRAHIAGVGDICGPKGAGRILREGRRLLESVSVAWGRTEEYFAILKAVEGVAGGGNGGARGDDG